MGSFGYFNADLIMFATPGMGRAGRIVTMRLVCHSRENASASRLMSADGAPATLRGSLTRRCSSYDIEQRAPAPFRTLRTL